ncbi:hypothetical protein, conserved [Leishmania tarentolae]|uniref:Uncharacterized protein n=1 Tax=Leishmania tarentolae TaxID=5689 RepID=A0A640KN68_LEITA|nr:hypothetical protein, conserved [Leishmania tarentolae]
MEQQAQPTPAARQQQQPQCSTNTVTTTRSTNEEAFDSVRQAAVVMFKQRTKDLTRLTQVETQCQAIEAELRQAQTCVTQLMAQQASLEALVEEEHERTRQRESRLQELHSALLQLDEEQQTSGKLQRSAEAAIGAATAFIQAFTNTDGQLFQLLTMASARTAGRSALELQRLFTDVQQGLVAAEAHCQNLMILPPFSPTTEAPANDDLPDVISPSSTAVVPSDVSITGVSHALHEWSAKMNWAEHGELADVVEILRQLVAWFSTGSSPQEEAQQAVAGEGALWEWGFPWPPLPESTEDAVTEDHWFGSLSLPSTTSQADAHCCGSADAAAEGDGPRAALPLEECPADANNGTIPSREAVQRVLQQHLLAPLQAILAYHAHLVSVCTQQFLKLPEDAPPLTASLAAAQQRWISFREAWQQWREDVLKTQTAAEAARAAETELGAAQAALRSLQQNCEEQSHHCTSRRKEVEGFKDQEINHYAAAWSKGVCASQAQRDSFCAMSDAVVSLREEASALATALHDDSEHHARETHAHDIALSEKQERLIATQQRVVVAKTRVATLEAECEERARVQHLVRDQHEELLSCATRCLQSSSNADGNNGDGVGTSEMSLRELGKLPVAQCAASVALKLLNSAMACSPAQAVWSERLLELASEAESASRGSGNSGLLASSVSQFFVSLMGHCSGSQATSNEPSNEPGNEPALDAAAVRLAVKDTAAGLRLPSDLFLDDVIDAELLAQVPYLRTLRNAEQASRASIDEHREFICDATAEISILRSELATVEE